MDPLIPFFCCVAGAMALYLLVRPAEEGHRGWSLIKVVTGLFALGLFAYLAAWAVQAFDRGNTGDTSGGPNLFFYVFATIALIGAVRMITHSRPVYSALYFVLVVLASAGVFLLLSAEFLAFALVIVYAGAILITYMFVLMLAQQAATPDEIGEAAEYDRNPREPAAAVFVGFIMLALLTNVMFTAAERDLAPMNTPLRANVAAWQMLDEMPGRRDAMIDAVITEGDQVQPIDTEGLRRIAVDPVTGAGYVHVKPVDSALVQRVDLPAEARPENIQQVGWALVAKFPVSLELAGVILLMAMFGAVVLARRQIEIGEAELHRETGLPHYLNDDDGGDDGPSGAAIEGGDRRG